MSRDNTKEDSQRVEASINKIKGVKEDFPAAAEEAEDESEDEQQMFQGELEYSH
jgi:hypothetical protein